MSIRDQITTEAASWIGTPFQHQASVKGVACDCIGLVRGVARAVGFRDPFTTGAASKYQGYGRTPEPVALLAACAEFLKPIEVASCERGDILLMRFERDPQHFALVLTRRPDAMIHSHASIGRVTSRSIDARWWRRVIAAYRYPELAIL